MGGRTLPYMLLAMSLALASLTGRPVRSAGTSACLEQVADGGFEAGGTAWQTTSVGGYAIISQLMPRTGQWGAYLAGYDSANDELAQVVVLPAGATTTLSFWWQMTTQESDHPWDTLDITVAPAGGGTPVRLQRLTDGSVAGAWQEVTIDLTAYAGQSLRLAFRARTDTDRPTDFYLDDITLAACSSVTPTTTAAPTATVTATLAATETPTPSPTPTATLTPTAPGPRVYLPLVLW